MTIVERILSLADAKGISRKELYTSCGIPKSTFSSWIAANPVSIPSNYIAPIAQLFDITCDELLTGDITDLQFRVELTDEHKNLIEVYKALDFEGKHLVAATIINEKRRIEQSKG